MTEVNSGDTAWMLAATALVILMTPALGLFYAGLVRAKNTLNTFMMCAAALAVATVTWALIGYSIAFGDANGIVGGFDHALLRDVTFVPRDGTTYRVEASAGAGDTQVSVRTDPDSERSIRADAGAGSARVGYRLP